MLFNEYRAGRLAAVGGVLDQDFLYLTVMQELSNAASAAEQEKLKKDRKAREAEAAAAAKGRRR